MSLAAKFEKPGSVDLGKIPTDKTGGLNKDAAAKRLETALTELASLQEIMYAAGLNGLLVVVQGRDTAGKDGTMDDVAGALNPVGIRIATFKAPTPAEAAHDFLWRVHAQTPGKGEVVFFNRSHYEDVLIARVHNLVPKPIWKERYGDINAFESLLLDNGIIVLKFCLHISIDEQKKRLLAREADPAKSWKLNPEDWKERAYWNAYTEAYEDAIGKCSSKTAPWYVVPSDHKWFRNLAIAEALVETLRPHKKSWLKQLEVITKSRREELNTLRASGQIEDPNAKS